MEYLVLDAPNLKFISSVKCHFSSAFLLDRKEVKI